MTCTVISRVCLLYTSVGDIDRNVVDNGRHCFDAVQQGVVDRHILADAHKHIINVQCKRNEEKMCIRDRLNALKSDFSTRIVLFIGCSLQDEQDIRFVYNQCKEECLSLIHIYEEAKTFEINGHKFVEGDWISIDGSTGNIYGEQVATVAATCLLYTSRTVRMP